MNAPSPAEQWKEGETIWLKTGPKDEHVFIVISPPDGTGKFLIVPLNTLQSYTLDKACVLDPEEISHPFLTEKSAIRYDRIREVTSSQLAKAKNVGLAKLRPHPKFRKQTVRDIQQSGLSSEFIEERFENMLRDLLESD